MVASCQTQSVSWKLSVIALAVKPKAFVSTLVLSVLFFVVSPLTFAATGDGKAVYGENGTGVLRTKDFTNATTTWGSEGNATTTSTDVRWVVTESNTQLEETMAVSASFNAGSGTLYISRHDSVSWNLDETETGLLDDDRFRAFDLAYEQDVGNALVVYSTGNTTDELGYYYYVAATTSWIGPCTLESNRTTGVVQWIELVDNPTGDEIALVFSDSNHDLSGYIWTAGDEDPSPANCGSISSNWNDQPALVLSTDLPETVGKSFDAAYEQTTGDLLVVWVEAGATGSIEYATNPGASTGWTTATEGSF